MDALSYAIFGALIGILFTVILAKHIRRWKLKKRMQKAKKSEYEAIKLMKDYGFEILDLQSKCAYTLYIDDKPHKVTVKADMIVKKGNKTYIAEVKSGDKVTSPKYTDTRRQLLEYYMVYRPNGLILVDMEKQKLRTVEYSILNHNKSEYLHRLIWALILLIIGFIVGFLTRGG